LPPEALEAKLLVQQVEHCVPSYDIHTQAAAVLVVLYVSHTTVWAPHHICRPARAAAVVVSAAQRLRHRHVDEHHSDAVCCTAGIPGVGKELLQCCKLAAIACKVQDMPAASTNREQQHARHNWLVQ
jgi:hypothetical protein